MNLKTTQCFLFWFHPQENDLTVSVSGDAELFLYFKFIFDRKADIPAGA